MIVYIKVPVEQSVHVHGNGHHWKENCCSDDDDK